MLLYSTFRRYRGLIWVAAYTGLFLCAEPANAARRVALLVGHPFGPEELTPLRYVGHDIERMREVLELLGGFHPDDIAVSFGEDAETVLERFEEARTKIEDHRQDTGDETFFLFYYSGHAQDGELRLGETRLPLMEIKRRVDQTSGDLRLALLDSCRSGFITRLKGATKGAPLSIGVEDAAAQRGLVLITASSENEDAQESDSIQGSFFTHFLASGLRGAADRNQDGNVTLSEAYNHAYANTVARTVGTRGGVQHPSYRFDLRGAGDVVLTRLAAPPSAIVFPDPTKGTYVVFDRQRQVIVAEFDKDPGRTVRVAVRPGSYVVKKRQSDHVELQDLEVDRGAVVPLDPAAMKRVAFADDYAKGAVVTTREVVYGKLGVRLSAALVAQTFLSAPTRRDYFPNLGLFQLSLDLDNAIRRNLGVRFDLGIGGSGDRALQISDPFLGDQDYSIKVSEITGGVSLTTRFPILSWLSVGAHGRLGMILLVREFVGVELPSQSFSTLTPGAGVEASIGLTDWLHAGVHVRLHYMFFNVDAAQSLTYLDGGAALTAVLR